MEVLGRLGRERKTANSSRLDPANQDLEPAVLWKREMDPDRRLARPREHHSHKEQ